MVKISLIKSIFDIIIPLIRGNFQRLFVLSFCSYQPTFITSTTSARLSDPVNEAIREVGPPNFVALLTNSNNFNLVLI